MIESGSLLVMLLLGMPTGPHVTDAGSPDPGLLAVPFSIASFHCVECGTCPPDDHWTDWFMPYTTYTGADHAGQCYSGSCSDGGHWPTCGGEENPDGLELAFAESEFGQLAVVLEALRGALSTSDTGDLETLVADNSSRMELVKSRRAIQVWGGCDGGIIAHFPL